MADRTYEKEGLKTQQNRLAFSKDLTTRINGLQNREIEMAIDADTPEEYDEKLYSGAIDMVQRETASAWSRRDKDWIEDLKAVVGVVVKIHAHSPEWLQKRLIEVAEQTWQSLEKPQKVAGHTVASTSIATHESALSLLKGKSITDRWNTAVDHLPAGVPQLIVRMLESKGRNLKNMTNEIQRMQTTRDAVKFTPNSIYTAELQSHVNSSAWLKDINDILIANNCDPGTRGKYWAELLLK